MNSILLADPDSYAWDFAERIQKYIQEKKGILIPLKDVSIKHFKNGEIDMHVPENVRKKIFILYTILQKTPRNGGLNLFY